MLTFISFLLTILGCVNWLLIGLLQYDFIAGLFGFQASMFSRICYILIGAGAVYFVIRIIINKGTVKIWERKKKKEMQSAALANANVEASKEKISTQEGENGQKFSDMDFRENTLENKSEEKKDQDNLFDEHFSQG